MFRVREFSVTAVPPRPAFEQFIFGNYAARVAKQIKQHPKGVGLNSQDLPLTPEVKLALMDLYLCKSENGGVMLVHTSFTPPSEKLQLRKEKRASPSRDQGHRACSA
jgi:hypothetical protein